MLLAILYPFKHKQQDKGAYKFLKPERMLVEQGVLFTQPAFMLDDCLQALHHRGLKTFIAATRYFAGAADNSFTDM